MESITKLLLLFAFTTFTTNIFAQTTPEEGSLGIRSTIGAQTAIEVPYQLNENLSVAPTVTFIGVENTSTTFGLGILPRYYISSKNSLSTYAMGNLGFNNTSFNAGGSTTFFVLGVGYGAEYFMSDNFSLSADAGLTANLGGDITNLLTTGARVSASVYF
ncbi:MAG: outer membrane beta-barrel protein [Balneola sp.]|jgi:hypothetical protein